MELISIVVPVYNVEMYLNDCIESLINQSYKNIEIILVNDGSTDTSKSICEKYVNIDSRIRVINKENQGLGLARNTGIEYCNGEYVTFIDSDDYADVDLIKNLYEGIKNNNADTCIGGFKRVTDSGNIIYTEKYRSKIYLGDEVKCQLFNRMLGSSPYESDAIRMSVWNVLYSTKIIRENNIKFPSEREYISEDIIFDSEYYRYSSKVAVVSSTAYNYRVNNNSLTMKYKRDRFEKVTFLYKELYNKLNVYKYASDSIVRLQRQYFVNVRSCIAQEKIKISGLSRRKSIKNIKNICNNSELQEVINTYPVYKLKIKQKFFLIMVKYKLSICLYLCSELKILKNT